MPVLLLQDIGAEVAARQDPKVVVGRPFQAVSGVRWISFGLVVEILRFFSGAQSLR
jgi:hypothetical protein